MTVPQQGVSYLEMLRRIRTTVEIPKIDLN